VAKSFAALLAMVLASVLVGAQELGPISRESQLNSSLAVSGSPLACSSPGPQVLSIPAPVMGRARVKARLINLLRESLYDDAKGVVNITREKEIKNLVSKLRKQDE
jgi:hypothetical protein